MTQPTGGDRQSRSIFLRTAVILVLANLILLASAGVFFEAKIREAVIRDREALAGMIARSTAVRIDPLLDGEDYDGIAVSLHDIAAQAGAVDLLVADGSGRVLSRVFRGPSGSVVAEPLREATLGGIVPIPAGSAVTLRRNDQLQAWAPVDAAEDGAWVRAAIPIEPLMGELSRLEHFVASALTLGFLALTACLLVPLRRAYQLVERRESDLIAEQVELRDAVYHDRLTGLLNRAGLAQRLEQALAARRAGDQLLAVCFLDLDGFKAVNDRYGHDVGDLLLVEVARRLSACVRQTDTVARLAGDEFVLLLEGENRPGEVMAIVEGVIARISQRVPAAGEPLRVGVSIGVAVRHSALDTADVLLKQADEAMYEAKRAGRNRWILHSSASGLLFSPPPVAQTAPA